MPPAVSPEWDKMVGEIVARRRAVPKDQRKKDLLQMFLDTNEENPSFFTEDVLREEIQLFMLAGSDTTSFTATCTLLLLLNNPAKLQALIQEVDTAFPQKDDPIAFDKTQSLPYLNAVINESLRMMPVAGAGELLLMNMSLRGLIVWIGLHRETTDTTTIHGYTFPPGVRVILAIYISRSIY